MIFRNFRSVIVVALVVAVVTNTNFSSAIATTSTLSLAVQQTPNASQATISLYGSLKPKQSGVKISIQVEIDKKWQSTALTTKTNATGTWSIEGSATALNTVVRYRARALVNKKLIYSTARTITIKELPEISIADTSTIIDQSGPGGYIHGLDISRWQHPNDAPIDFVKAYSAGVRFVMIKASDTRDISDAQALKYLVMDHNAAQAAGIYTGFYHYATLPDSTDPAVIVADAKAQAQKVLWRLASLGGYTERDLSYALDLENKCVRLTSGGACAKNATRSATTLWATTWLAMVAEKTNRLPILYSYPTFLEGSMVRTAELLKYPLWIAHYAINPADPLAKPGQKSGGCFVHSWTTATCETIWTFWQYSSCGIGKKYGIPSTRVDLNVFRGPPSSFLQLVKGTWVPEVSDLMPKQEPSQTFVESITATTSNKNVIFSVMVKRPDASPVVTGTVRYFANKDANLLLTPQQSVVRLSSGSWILTVKGIPAGTWPGRIKYTDISGTHAISDAPVVFTLSQGPTGTPTPTPPSTSPTPKPPVTPKPAVDGCANQIKN